MPRWLLAVILMSGCGFALNGPDPQRPRTQMPKCDTGKGAVVVDGIMATLAGVIALSVAGTSEPALALIPAGIGAIYIGGAVHGNRAVDECRAAMGDYEQVMSARETLDRTPPPVADNEDDERRPPMRQPPVAVAPPPVVAAPPVAGPPGAGPPGAGPPSMTPVAGPPSPPVAGPPAPPAPAATPPKKRAAPPAPKQTDDEWSDFWREIQ